tara:strand:+ start:440 stop:1057 length:618 start_codon:yes stop_codon:yes gene_type:complete
LRINAGKISRSVANLIGRCAGFSSDSFTDRISVIAKAAAIEYISLSDVSVIKEAAMQERFTEALKEAVKSQDKIRISTLRLITAAIKDRDIAARGADRGDGASEEQVLEILAKMVKQRQEAATTYEEAGRLELAEQERAEILVIEEFLPAQLSDDEIQNAVNEAIAQTEAESLKDMGKVMGALKGKYAGQMDFGKAGGLVKQQLG